MTAYLHFVLKYLPILTIVVLVGALVLVELRGPNQFGLRTKQSGQRCSENMSIPTNGYTYHISDSISVLIVPKWPRSFCVYPSAGTAPQGVALSEDRYGRYFKLYCASAVAAEHELDRLYLGGDVQ